ncbi:MAG: MAC/perforin domain-containing protein [Pseudomonadota bacterium]
MSENLIPGAGFAGWGFDIFGSYDQSSAKQQIFAEASDTTTYTMPGTDQAYALPDSLQLIQVGEGGSKPEFFETRLDLQTYFSQKADLKGGASLEFGSFSGAWQGKFEVSAASEIDYVYALFFSRYQNFTLRLKNEGSSDLAPGAAADIAELPDTFSDDNRKVFFNFFDTYGTHYVDSVTVGGELNYWISVIKSHSSLQVEVEDKATLEFDALFLSKTKGESETKWNNAGQAWYDSRTVTVMVKGGQPSDLNIGTPSFGQDASASYAQWYDSISKYPVPISFTLKPLYSIFGIQRQTALEAATNQYLTENILSVETNAANSTVPQTTPQPPVIVIGQPIDLATTPEYQSGFQVVILEINEQFHRVMFNKAYSTLFWDNTDYGPVEAMFDEIYTDVTSQGFDQTGYIGLFASFGWTLNAPPSQKAQGLFQSFGASEGLQKWLASVTSRGSYNQTPVSYILAGPGGKLDAGAETLLLGTDGTARLRARLGQESVVQLPQAGDVAKAARGSS